MATLARLFWLEIRSGFSARCVCGYCLSVKICLLAFTLWIGVGKAVDWHVHALNKFDSHESQTFFELVIGFCLFFAWLVAYIKTLDYAASHFFFPFVLSKISIHCLLTPLFSNAFTNASFCGP